MTNNKTGFDPTPAVEDWLERKIHCVPLRPKSKRPKDTNWPKMILNAPDKISRAFKIGDNLGGLWGEPSDHITDLDLDLEEACLVAPHILPETFVYGRKGKESSHYLFRCIGAETRKWMIREIGTIVEIRSTGTQSALPPSRYPDGGRYFIENDVEFKQISKREFEQYAVMIAIAAIILKFYPQSGSRHDYVHAATGMLCHAKWDEDSIKLVMGAVLSVVQDEETEMPDRKGAVLNTIEHYKIGDRVQGFRTLETWMSTAVIQQLRRWTNTSAKESTVLSLVPTTPKRPEETDFNMGWLEVPGLVGDIAKWAGKSSFIQQPAFDLATGIMCTALATCNNYIIDTWDTPLQPYIMVTAPTGGGKGAVLKAIQRFAHELDLGDYVRRGFQSYYAMLDELAEPPNMAVWLWDEAARHMATAKGSASQEFQTLSHVISLYGQANEWVPGTPGRRQTIPALDRPFLLVLATAQPDQLMLVLTRVAEETGLINRFGLFDSGEGFPQRNRQRTTVFPAAIGRAARLLRDHEPQNGEVTRVGFDTTKAYTMFDDFEEASRRRTFRKEYVWARANQNALIMAGIAAVGVDANKPMITEDIARWAIEIASWSNEHWADKIRLIGGETVSEQESFKVENCIRHPNRYIESALKQSKVQSDLAAKGFMHHSLLLRVTRGLTVARRDQILDELHEADLISSSGTPDGNSVMYWGK